MQTFFHAKNDGQLSHTTHSLDCDSLSSDFFFVIYLNVFIGVRSGHLISILYACIRYIYKWHSAVSNTHKNSNFYVFRSE